MNWIEGEIVAKRQWTQRLYSLCFEAPLAAFRAGQFVRVGLDINGERIARPYSLVNAPAETPHEIYFSVVDHGALTPSLAALKEGDKLFVGNQALGFFTIDELPTVPHLWLVATGTGIGPYLSILRDTLVWQRFERIVLVYGVSREEDLSYQMEIASLRERFADRLSYVALCSREKTDRTLFGRIPGNIENGQLEAAVGLTLSPENSHVMLCGHAAMIEAARAVLERRGMRRHRRREPGHITAEQYY